jgi:hypothetical protein
MKFIGEAGDSQQCQRFAAHRVFLLLLLLPDNACLHSAVATIEAIRQLKFELLPHPHGVQT